jgi:hypothetical protein
VIVVNEVGLRRVLASYVAYYMRSRTHLGLAKDSPVPRPVQSASTGRIVSTPEVAACTTATIASPRSRSRQDVCFPSALVSRPVGPPWRQPKRLACSHPSHSRGDSMAARLTMPRSRLHEWPDRLFDRDRQRMTCTSGTSAMQWSRTFASTE